MKNLLTAVVLLIFCSQSLWATSETSAGSIKTLRVVTTLKFLQGLASEIGKNHVNVLSLGNEKQDPHFVTPRPTLMKHAREADVFIDIGLDLELWAKKVVDGARNSKIYLGQPGRIVASRGIRTLEIPAVLSREFGDIHPQGNPHVWLDPLKARKVASNIAKGLQRVDPMNAVTYQKNLENFFEQLDIRLFGKELVTEVGGQRLGLLAEQGRLFDYLHKKELIGKLGGWLKMAEPLRGSSVVTYHKTWVYLAKRFGFDIPIEIEEKPGISPSAKHKSRVIQVMREKSIKTILLASFYERSAAGYIANETGAQVVQLPIDSQNYFGFIDQVLSSLLSK